MGLFSPPKENIRKKIPAHGQLEFAMVQTFAEMQLEDFDRNPREYALAFILSVWACNSALAAKFQLSEKDYKLIQNAGVLSVGRLDEYQQSLVGEIIEALIEKELIPFSGEQD